MLGGGRRQGGSQNPPGQIMGAAAGGINSLGSGSKYHMGMDPGGVGGQGSGARLSLPKIHFGGQRNMGGMPYITDSAARAGALGGPLDRNRMMVGQQSPFVGKPPHGSDVDNMNPGLQGKMTPMYV